MKIHGYEIVALRYFRINDDGTLHYLDDDDLAKAPRSDEGERRRRATSCSRTPSCSSASRAAGSRCGATSARTSATRRARASAPASRRIRASSSTSSSRATIAGDDEGGELSAVVGLVLDHAELPAQARRVDGHRTRPAWRRSGASPRASSTRRTASFVGPHIPAGNSISKDWRTEFESQPKRELPFRFGYYDKKNANHLIIMRRKK